MDIDRDAGSGSFYVSTYNDGTIYRGRLNDPHVPVYIEGTLGQTTEGITIARGLLYTNAAKLGTVPRRCGSLAGRRGVGFGRFLV